MLFRLFKAALRDRRRWLLGWSAGISILLSLGIWGLGEGGTWLGEWLEVLGIEVSVGEPLLWHQIEGFSFGLALPWLLGIPLAVQGVRWLGEPASRESIAFLCTLPISRAGVLLMGVGFHWFLYLLLLSVSLLVLMVNLVLRGLPAWVGIGIRPVLYLSLLMAFLLHGAMVIGLKRGHRLGAILAVGGLFLAYLLTAIATMTGIEVMAYFSPLFYYFRSIGLAGNPLGFEHVVLWGLNLALVFALGRQFSKTDL
jgi:hypothetical protein